MTAVQQLSLGQLGLGVAIAASSILQFAQPALALSEDDLRQLCDRYPGNTQCETYEQPIPLSERSGTTGRCALNTSSMGVVDFCKVEADTDTLTVYIETGDRIGTIGNNRRTALHLILANQVTVVTYREETVLELEQRVEEKRIASGLPADIFIPPDRAAQIEVRFSERAISADSAITTYSTLSFAADIETGERIKAELERMTGRPVRVEI